ncbi:MAG: hypothetical protein WDN76_06945 [Alphaproteobacteria bacterium]
MVGELISASAIFRQIKLFGFCARQQEIALEEFHHHAFAALRADWREQPTS